jgi:hypothetical protein
MRTPQINPTIKGALCVVILFVLSFAAAAERQSDLFYNVLLSPFILTGLPTDPSYAVFFGVAIVFLLALTTMATATKHRAVQLAGLFLWLPHIGGAFWVIYRSDWHPFMTRLSPGIVLTILFAGVYLYWTFAVVSPLWRGVRGGRTNQMQ